MKYFLIILIFFIGCSEKNHKKVYIQDIVETNLTQENQDNENYNENIEENKSIETKPKILKIKDLNFTEENGSFIYNFNKNKILVFINDNQFSKQQIKALKKEKEKFYIIQNKKLIQFFNIKKYPTIIITKDNNNSKKYEGFLPYEVLKYEIKD